MHYDVVFIFRIVSDHNRDQSALLLTNWVKAHQSEYHEIQLEIEEKVRYHIILFLYYCSADKMFCSIVYSNPSNFLCYFFAYLTNFWFSVYETQKTDLDWPEERHIKMLKLRQEALDIARQKWSDYVLVRYLLGLPFY